MSHQRLELIVCLCMQAKCATFQVFPVPFFLLASPPAARLHSLGNLPSLISLSSICEPNDPPLVLLPVLLLQLLLCLL